MVTDPSECVDSSRILPTLQEEFSPVYEASYGGELLMFVLKDIAHHFIVLNPENIFCLGFMRRKLSFQMHR